MKDIARYILVLMMSFYSLVSAGAASDADSILESYNKTMFRINDNLDQAVIKPVAKTYKNVVPSPIKSGVTNFFNNLRDGWTAVNQFLEGKPNEGMSDLGRFVINTTFGIGGLFDLASADNIPKHNKDFGQTLGKWGVGEGGYFVIPVLGPSTIRDTLCLYVDWMADPVSSIDRVPVRNSMYVIRGVDDRRALLNTTDAIDEMAVDRYQAYKNAWLSHRRYEVSDGAYVAPDEDIEEVQ
jgi:phospholipid-binding lipoprotein MlaA